MDKVKKLNDWTSEASVEDIEKLSDKEISDYAMERPGHPGVFGFMLDPKRFKSLEHSGKIMFALMKRLGEVKKIESEVIFIPKQRKANIENYVEKITSVTLRERDEAGDYSSDKVSVLDNGDLDFSSYDIGALPEKCWGHDDYEFDLFLGAEWKDTVLLTLLKDRFQWNSDFQKWADENKIPYKTTSWP